MREVVELPELVLAGFRIRQEQRDYLNKAPEGAAERVRRLIDEDMTRNLPPEAREPLRRVVIAGEALTFPEWVKGHLRWRSPDGRRAYLTGPAARDYLADFGRTVYDVKVELARIEGLPVGVVTDPAATPGVDLADGE